MLKAVWKGHFDVSERLIVGSVDIDIEDNDEQTALMWAEEYGHAQIIELLSGRKPDTDETIRTHDKSCEYNSLTQIFIVSSPTDIDIDQNLFKEFS